MAKLLKTPAPGDWSYDLKIDYEIQGKRWDKQIKALEPNVIRFPVADGYALYYVKSLSPLTLQHIPVADLYCASPILIRGLRRADVEKMISDRQTIKKLFSKKG